MITGGALMSIEYTNKLISEIDLYISNLHKFLSYDMSVLENEYNHYIEQLNNNTLKAVVPAIEEIKTITTKKKEIELLINEAKKEKDILEKQKITVQAIYDAKKKKINSCKVKIKKLNKELELANEHVKDPLRWVLGYKTKDQEEIISLQKEITECQIELEAFEKECENTEIKELNSRIKRITENIEALIKESNSITTNSKGRNVEVKSRAESILLWLSEEYSISKECWLGVEKADKATDRNIIPSQALNDFKQVCRKINISSIKGYTLMNYKFLLELLALLPNKLYGIGIEKTYPFHSYNGVELDEGFSAACQAKFKELCSISPTGTTDILREWEKNYISVTNTAYTDFLFPKSPIAINSDFINELIYDTAKSTSSPEQIISDFDPLIKNVAEIAVAEEQISTAFIQRKFKIGYARAAKIIEELAELGIIGRANGSKPCTIINYNLSAINFNNTVEINKGTSVAKLLVSKESLDEFEEAKTMASSNFIDFTYVNEEFLLRLKKIIEANPEADLPEIAMEFRADEIDEYVNIAEEFISFRNLYRETPEQIIKTNQEFFAKKEIEQIRENARKEREMYERQAELDREAENQRARIMAQAESERAEAERERTAAIERQTSSLATQARLDRAAAERRSDEALEHARYEARQKQLREQAAARTAHHDEVLRARSRCLQCAHRGVCHNKETPNCASFVPK